MVVVVLINFIRAKNFMNNAVDFADNIDFSKVAVEDRPTVRQIVIGILTFNKTMPKVRVDIFGTHDHYNITFADWNQRIDDSEWYNKYLSPTRDDKYDAILKSETIPSEGGSQPIKLVKVRRSSFANKDGKKKK